MTPEIQKSNEVIEGLMPKENFEKRFSFIDNETLKKNIAIAFEYIVFLIDAAGMASQKPLIRSSLYKDAVVHTGIIVEACLCHVLNKYLASGKAKKTKVLDFEWREEAQGVIYEFSKKKRIRYIVEHAVLKNLKNSPDFIEINRTCLRAKILSQKEFGLAEEVRIARNKIHVSGLKEIDNSYSKEKLDAIFDKATIIIKKVEKRLSKI